MSHLLGRNAAARLTGNNPKQTATLFAVAIIVPSVPENIDTHHCDVTAVNAELLELLFSRHLCPLV